MSEQELYNNAVQLLKQLIGTPSFSKEEDQTAAIIKEHLQKQGITVELIGNNVLAKNKYFDAAKPTILLNSHHDTVKPNPNYTLNPFEAIEKDAKLYGLGSNDAGGCLVSLIATFIYFFDQQNLKYNVMLVASAEEEISGYNGIEAVLNSHLFFKTIDGTTNSPLGVGGFAIVGEPTLMQMAVAERGLLVLDATAHGRAGHAARNEGDNAIIKALRDIEWIHQHQFEQVSPLLGANKMSVTVIETENKAHNVVPAVCKYVIDVRVNELYSFEEVITEIQKNIQSEIKPRSTRLRSTSIPVDHPIIQAGLAMNKTMYGSPTTSDKALMPFPALKMGPGDSARSHTADEFIYLKEIEQGIKDYIEILDHIIL